MAAVIDNILPVFAIIGLGAILKRKGLITPEFMAVSDRLIYFILFPLLLFWKIGGRPAESAVEWPLVLAVLLTVLTTWLASLAAARLIGLKPFQVGAFSQCAYRFNTYVGLAVFLSAHGDHGAAVFGVIIGPVIPFINLLAVGTLIHHSPGRAGGPAVLAKAVVSNPLIVACLLGLGYSRLGLGFPVVVDNALNLLAPVSLPLALVSIGGGLSLAKLHGRVRPALTAALIKQAVLPAAGLVWMTLLAVPRDQYALGLIYFALPTSTASYILSAQLSSDADLAGAAIVASTFLSIASLSLVLAFFGA